MNNEKELFEILEGMNDIYRKIYQTGYRKGFEDGKKAKEKEYEDYHHWLDARNEEFQVIRELEEDC